MITGGTGTPWLAANTSAWPGLLIHIASTLGNSARSTTSQRRRASVLCTGSSANTSWES